MGYPQKESERQMLNAFVRENPLDSLEPVMSREELLGGRRQVREIRAGEAVQDYILAIVEATRSHEKIRLGVSPRGSLALLRASQAWAGISGRDYVIPDDVKAVCCDVLSHRLLCRGSHLSQGPQFAREVLTELLQQVPVPTEAEISG